MKDLDSSGEKIDVVIAADDYMALGAMQYLKENNIAMPETIAVGGFDDIKLAAYSKPQLTTMRQPTFELGIKAIQSAYKLLQGEKIPLVEMFSPELIIRQSCGCGIESHPNDEDDTHPLIVEERNTDLYRFGEGLINTFKHDEIKRRILDGCESLEISLFIVLFQQERTKGKVYIHYDYRSNTMSEKIILDIDELMPCQIKMFQNESVLTLPLQKDDEAFGMIHFLLNKEEMDDFAFLTDRIARSIQGAILVERLNDHTLELEELVKQRTEELQKANTMLLSISYTDELSGLKNRRFLKEVIENETAIMIQSSQMKFKRKEKRSSDSLENYYGLVLLDIDFFKKINDSYGHDAGDYVIKKIAQLLTSTLRASDYVIRYSGEEFLIILKNIEHGFLEKVAEKIRLRIEAECFILPSGEQIYTSCSFGGSYLPATITSPCHLSFWDIITICDVALYYAKRNGRNQSVIVNIINENLETPFPRILDLPSLEKAIEAKQVSLAITKGKSRTEND